MRKFAAILLLLAGCVTASSLELDAKHPSIEVRTAGFYVNNAPASAKAILATLEDMEVPHERVIHIRIDKDVTDLRPARMLMGYLAKNGYTRPVLVTERHAESEAREKKSKWR